MTTEIALPAHSVVLVLGHARHSAPVSELCDRIPGLSCPFDIMKPDASHDRLLAALSDNEIVRVAMLRSHPKVRRKVAASARKRGFIAIALRLPGAEEVGADEGYAQIIDIASPDEAEFKITPMPSDLSHMTGPFDIIGDVHGCADELEDLLVKLEYLDAGTKQPQPHPAGRTLILLGDLTDRGPANLRVLRLVRDLETYGALRVLGNHDFKAARWLSGNKVEIRAGIETTVAELDSLPDSEKRDLGAWLGAAQHHLLLDGRKLVVAHAGISEERQGSHSEGSVAMALYGLPTGELDEDGHPEAEDWALSYTGSATVVHGHVVYPEPRVVNNVIAIDTGCVFGGKLTAYRWPERDYVSVEARQTYSVSERLGGSVCN